MYSLIEISDEQNFKVLKDVLEFGGALFVTIPTHVGA